MASRTMRAPRSISRRLAERPFFYGIFSLILLGVVSFIFVFSYFSDSASADAQAAAAASSTIESAFDGISLQAEAAIVVDLVSGEVLFEKSADAQLALASLTKVALILAVSEVLDPDETIAIPLDMDRLESVHVLPGGEVWSVRDMMRFTLVTSSNQGAVLLAEAAAPRLMSRYPGENTGSATIARMNNLALELGLTQTYFLNPHGLDVSATQSGAYGSARDMAGLFARAATMPELFSATAKDALSLSSGVIGTAVNTNEALPGIPGLIMGKTGYTDLAGGNLAVVFDVGLAHPVAAVVLGSSREGRFTDMSVLVDTARREIIGL